MKIKVKLTLGVGLLFLFIILLAALGTYNIQDLNRDTQNILVANYNTLDYSREMLMALDEDMSKESTRKKFLDNLNKQQKNITEKGEKELTGQLARDFEQLRINPRDSLLYISLRKDLAGIMLLNMEAIQRKSDIAKQTARKATWWIAIIGTFCFIIAFILLVNLPGNIANPIKELTESIKQIAGKNYSQRVHFESHSEFGQLAGAFNTMAQKLQEYDSSNLSKLLMQNKRIETLINNLHDPVIGLDENMKILFANDEALLISGLKAAEMIGKPAQEIAVTNDLVRSLIRDLVSPGHANGQEQLLKIFAHNKESYFQKEIIPIRIVPTGEKETRQIGHFILLRNITRFKELDFAKTNFIATVSHELKTPISSIKMSLQLLQNNKTGPVNDEQWQLMESIKEDSDRLLKITSELLNLSQVETGNIQLNIQQTPPTEILQYAIDAVRTHAEQKNVHLKTDAETGLPQVKADAEKTAWVLVNLLTNAIRYTSAGNEIIVTVKKHQEQVQFAVKDFGTGIESRYQDKIFDRYFQVPGSSRSGTGLGLAISKEFIEAQGGKIGVESQPGEGSTFYFLLPV